MSLFCNDLHKVKNVDPSVFRFTKLGIKHIYGKAIIAIKNIVMDYFCFRVQYIEFH